MSKLFVSVLLFALFLVPVAHASNLPKDHEEEIVDTIKDALEAAKADKVKAFDKLSCDSAYNKYVKEGALPELQGQLTGMDVLIGAPEAVSDYLFLDASGYFYRKAVAEILVKKSGKEIRYAHFMDAEVICRFMRPTAALLDMLFDRHQYPFAKKCWVKRLY